MGNNSDLAVVAVTLGLMAIATYMAYVTYLSHRSVQPASEVWEVQSDRQGIPERITVRR